MDDTMEHIINTVSNLHLKAELSIIQIITPEI